ncbi:MAG: hypothetical protein OSB05_03570 [Akkermansiaceae bacterium]|nr:hypothetical protein [Akkermansiaceae bacterium]
MAPISSSFWATGVGSEADFNGINTLNGGNNGASLTVSDGLTTATTAPAGQVGIIDSGGGNK